MLDRKNIVRITITSEEILSAIHRLQVVVSEKKMAFISLKTDRSDQKELLKMSATDASLDVYTSHPCGIQGEGECHMNAQKFIEIIKQLPPGEVGLSLESNTLVVRMCEKSRLVIKIPVIAGYVWIPEQTFVTSGHYHISSSQLEYMISQVVICLYSDPTYRFSDLAYLHQPQPNVLRMVATDVVKLSYSEIHGKLPGGFLQKGVCLSKKAITAILKMCECGAEKIEFTISENQKICHFHLPGYDIFVRTVHAAYPDYSFLMPQEIFDPIILDRAMLISMLKRIMLSMDKSKILSLYFTEGEFELSAHNDTGAEGKEVLAAKFSRDPLRFGMNAELFFDDFIANYKHGCGFVN